MGIHKAIATGPIKRLFHYRYGRHELPDDDAGRGDLWLLMLNASLAAVERELKMHNVIDLHAPWMGHEEREGYVRLLKGLDHNQCIQTGRAIGNRLYLRNEERQALRLTQFKPIDATDEELEEQRKARRRENRRAKREANGVQPREVYLAEMASKAKPWVAAGMTRATYYRKMRRGLVPTILSKAVPDLVSPTKLRVSKGYQEVVCVEKQHQAEESERMDTNEPTGSRGQVTDLVSQEENDPRMAALGNWGLAHEAKLVRDQRERFEKIRARFDALARSEAAA